MAHIVLETTLIFETTVVRSKKGTLNTLGKFLRELRKQRKLLIREVAASLSLDQTLLSKIERDERKPTKEQLASFCKFYKDKADEIQTEWLSDKIVKELQDHKLAAKALDLAESKLKTKLSKKK